MDAFNPLYAYETLEDSQEVSLDISSNSDDYLDSEDADTYWMLIMDALNPDYNEFQQLWEIYGSKKEQHELSD